MLRAKERKALRNVQLMPCMIGLGMKIYRFQVELVCRGLTPGDAFAHAVHKLASGQDGDVVRGEIVFSSIDEEDMDDEFLSELMAASSWSELVVGET